MSEYERNIAIRDAEQISASDAYFKARHDSVDTIDRRKVFEAGFNRAWEALAKREQDDARDAERYRWLRSQFWADGGLCVIKDAKKYTRLGAYMPFEKLLDDELDAAILATSQQQHAKEKSAAEKWDDWADKDMRKD